MWGRARPVILEGPLLTGSCEEDAVKAIIQDKYGPPLEVLSLQTIDMPVIKKDHEVLLRGHTAAVAAGDWLLMSGQPVILRLMFGLRKPRKKIPGFDLSGYVEEVGSKVTEFRPGDEVFGTCKGSCAEYAVTSVNRLAPKPAKKSYRELRSFDGWRKCKSCSSAKSSACSASDSRGLIIK